MRELCDRRGLLLIFDEVQTGMGRTGTLFAYEQSGITPDIMTLAKGLGAGVPIGAMLATEEVAGSFSAGAHGSTFGGNALTCAVGVAVMHALLDEGVLANCEQQGRYLRERLEQLRTSCPRIRDVRGDGLLVGVELDGAGRPGGRSLPARRLADQLHGGEGAALVAAADRVARRDRCGGRHRGAGAPAMKRDFLSLADFTRAELEEILHLSATLKRDLKAGKQPPLLGGKSLAMIFEKPSLRTRVTFEVGMTQLGGSAINLTPKDIQLGERESVADIARNLERWVDLIMARTFSHGTLLELAAHRRGAGDQRALGYAAPVPSAGRLLYAGRAARPARRLAGRLRRRRQQRRQLVDERRSRVRLRVRARPARRVTSPTRRCSAAHGQRGARSA